jgi:lycopene cyclase CruP
MSLAETILTDIPGQPLTILRNIDQRWLALRTGDIPIPTVVREEATALTEPLAFDAVIAGGTLGILVGTALVLRGWKVALLERGELRGRDQEWNISRRELDVLLELNLLTEDELNCAIAMVFNPVRVQFHTGDPVWVRDVLNIGVSPVRLLALLKTRFLNAGGTLYEHIALDRVVVHPNGVAVYGKPLLQQETGEVAVRSRLLIDMMGHGSPVVQQARQGKAPDSVCLVVGTCAMGYPDKTTGDLMVSFTPAQRQCQYFWEAFPAEDGRTTYLFTYLTPHPDRPSLATLFEDYFQLLPQYQGVELAQLTWKRALMGYFPCYRQSPLTFLWDRIVPMGDSSGSQSPLSFGGFGALLRHLGRLTDATEQALQADALSAKDLALLQPYQPSLSVTWLFQKAMSMGVHQSLDPNQINQLLVAVFQEMEALGEPVLKPFLQDVVQFSGLSATLLKTAIARPQIVLKVVPQVGLPALIDWLIHYWNLGAYTGLHSVLTHFASPLPARAKQFRWQRWREAFQFGSGQDYHAPVQDTHKS